MKIGDKCTGEAAGSAPVSRANTPNPKHVFGFVAFCSVVKGLERFRGGHPASMRGRGIRPEKFLTATADRNVLGGVPVLANFTNQRPLVSGQ